MLPNSKDIVRRRSSIDNGCIVPQSLGNFDLSVSLIHRFVYHIPLCPCSLFSQGIIAREPLYAPFFFWILQGCSLMTDILPRYWDGSVPFLTLKMRLIWYLLAVQSHFKNQKSHLLSRSDRENLPKTCSKGRDYHCRKNRCVADAMLATIMFLKTDGLCAPFTLLIY